MGIVELASDLASRALTRDAEIREIRSLNAHFRLIKLGGEQLRGASWSPGDKVQIRTKLLTFRTFTPIRWTGDSTELLIYLHGRGPGSEMISKWTAGDRCQIFGPRGSIKLASVVGRPIFVGDETSFGLAACWMELAPDRPANYLFESSSAADSASALSTLKIEARVAPAKAHEATELDEWVCSAVAADPSAPLVMSGRAQTIKRLRRALKERGLRAPTTFVKAYWDENRAGLD